MEDECVVLAVDASQCCHCRRGRISVIVRHHMTTLVPLLFLLTTFCRDTNAMCPTRCQCNDDKLQTSCSGAALQVVPIQLNPELKHINLSHNKISSVHYTLEIYANLITLDVSHNRIQKLGSLNFMSQGYMKTLNVSNNMVENLQKDVFKGLASLEVLDLSSNYIEDISIYAFSDLPLLEILLLTDNRLVSFDSDVFKHQTNLRVLHLDENQLLEIPIDNLVYTKKLETLSLSKNLIEYVEEGSLPTLKFLRYLALDTNVISDIHGNAFDGFTALESLNLADNNFTNVPTTQLSKLSNLLQLNLSGNFFTNLSPVAFRGLFQLRELNLNGIGTLTKIDVRTFVDNINLETVSLNDNIALAKLPTRLFHGNPRLTRISIRNNMLSTLEASHFPLDQLTSLQIGDNPLYCNCSLMWLWKLVTEQKNSVYFQHRSSTLRNETELESNTESNTQIEMVLDVDDIRCADPEKLADMLLVDAFESDIQCAPNWLAVATGSTTAVCILAVIFLALVYSGALRRCSSRSRDKNYIRREQPSRTDNPQASTTSDRQHGRDKYEHIMGPPLLSEYQTLPTWETFAGNKDSDFYQFGYHTNIPHHQPRPHVVYV